MKRILGIDYGDSRIGIAVSDPMGWTAQAVETIKWQYHMEAPLKRIVALIGQYGCDKVIIGFPRNMNGTVGERGEKTQRFIEQLESRCENLQIIKWDERLTTVAAHRTMKDLNVKTKKKKDIVDQIAAVYILQGYLDSQ